MHYLSGVRTFGNAFACLKRTLELTSDSSGP